MKCAFCGKEIDELDFAREINPSTPKAYHVCELCYDDLCVNNEVVACFSCGAAFDAGFEIAAEHFGEQSFYPCPSCGNDITEGFSRSEAITEAINLAEYRVTEAKKYLSELLAFNEKEDGQLWFPVTVVSNKRGGGIRAHIGRSKRSADRPEDTSGSTQTVQVKTRYFSSLEEAKRVMNVIQSLEITIKRVRGSATQGEVQIFINGQYILNFGDSIDLLNPEEYYGDDIGGWRSHKPDSAFVLGLIWHPLDHAYHYSDIVCKKLGIKREEWI